MSFSSLSEGSIERMLTKNEPEQPVIQVLDLKRLLTGNGIDRWRLLISDGKHLHRHAMLASHLNQHVPKFSKYGIIRVMEHSVSVINTKDPINKRVLILLNLDTLHAGEEVAKQIGSPVLISNDNLTISHSQVNPVPSSSDFPSSPGTSRELVATSQMSSSGLPVRPIDSLSPFQNKWVIKARVTNKSHIRTWENNRGKGKLFSMDLLDKSGEIRATIFQDLVDKYYNTIQVGKVYLFINGKLKEADKRYSTLQNYYEIISTNETIIGESIERDGESIPTIQYNFVPISSILQLDQDSIIDIVGVCLECSEVQNFTVAATGKEGKKRDIVLADQSLSSVSLTLFGDDAINFMGPVGHPVVLVKGAKVSEFGGRKSVNVSYNGMILVNPDVADCQKLRSWYDHGGSAHVGENLSLKRIDGSGMRAEWLTFYEVQKNNLGYGEKPDYFQAKGNIHEIKATNPVYKACPQQGCGKKLGDPEYGMYRCEKCAKEYSNFNFRLLIYMDVSDWSGRRDWVTCFVESAEKILGCTSQEVGLMEQNELAANFARSGFSSFVFKFRIKNEFYGDSYRTKINVVDVAPVNYKEYNGYLISNITRITGLRPNSGSTVMELK